MLQVKAALKFISKKVVISVASVTYYFQYCWVVHSKYKGNAGKSRPIVKYLLCGRRVYKLMTPTEQDLSTQTHCLFTVPRSSLPLFLCYSDLFVLQVTVIMIFGSCSFQVASCLFSTDSNHNSTDAGKLISNGDQLGTLQAQKSL